ncbi:MAG: transposase [Proteobacteria bacterium]|nr:transposase [Pseudomonadota bacterium]
MIDISNPIFHDETKAPAYLENLRWANGRFCPHCGEAERTSPAKAKGRVGLYVCLSCKKQFTVRVGSICERSHIPLDKWAPPRPWRLGYQTHRTGYQGCRRQAPHLSTTSWTRTASLSAFCLATRC